MREELRIREATALIEACVKRINDYPVSFNGLTTDLQVVQLYQHSIEAIHQLFLHDKPLMACQSMFGLAPGTFHPMIMDALRNKTQLTINAADAQRQLIRETAAMIRHCIQNIQAFVFTFEQTNDERDIDRQSHLLKDRLQQLLFNHQPLQHMLHRLGLTIHHMNAIQHAYHQQLLNIYQVRKLEKDKIIRYKHALQILNQVNFLDHLLMIKDQMHITEIMADLNGEYAKHIDTAKIFYLGLSTVKNQFLHSTNPMAQALLEFQTNCLHLVQEHRAHLSSSAWWSKLLDKTTALVSNLTTTTPSQIPQEPFRFFTPSAPLNHETPISNTLVPGISLEIQP